MFALTVGHYALIMISIVLFLKSVGQCERNQKAILNNYDISVLELMSNIRESSYFYDTPC